MRIGLGDQTNQADCYPGSPWGSVWFPCGWISGGVPRCSEGSATPPVCGQDPCAMTGAVTPGVIDSRMINAVQYTLSAMPADQKKACQAWLQLSDSQIAQIMAMAAQTQSGPVSYAQPTTASIVASAPVSNLQRPANVLPSTVVIPPATMPAASSSASLTGSTTLLGLTLPTWEWLAIAGGAAILLFALTGKK